MVNTQLLEIFNQLHDPRTNIHRPCTTPPRAPRQGRGHGRAGRGRRGWRRAADRQRVAETAPGGRPECGRSSVSRGAGAVGRGARRTVHGTGLRPSDRAWHKLMDVLTRER